MHFLLLENIEKHGFVEILLHFFKQMHLGLGLGGLCPEEAQTSPQRAPCGAGAVRPASGWAASCTGHGKDVQFCAPEFEAMYIQQWLLMVRIMDFSIYRDIYHISGRTNKKEMRTE